MNAQLPITEDATAQLPAIRRTEVRVVEDIIPVLDTARFEHMQRIATAMSRCSLIPETLRGESDLVTAANCFLVVNQAVQWNMDPFQVAQCVSVINGRLMHEGKLIAAVIEAKLGIKLHKEWRGQGEQMSIVVSNPRDATECVTGTVAEWKTTRSGSPWVPKQYQKMLWYRGVREWCRMYAPGLILGIYSPDEAWDDAGTPAIEPPTPPAIEAPVNMPLYPPDTTRFPKVDYETREAPAPQPPTPNGLPPIDETLHSAEVIATLQKPAISPGTDALGGKPGTDAIPPGLRRAKGPPPFKLDAWLATLKKECDDKTPAQLIDLRVKMIEPLRERLGHEGYNRAGDVLGAAMEVAQKKYGAGLPEPIEPIFNADAWYNDLSGAISGCTSIEQVIKVQETVQKPALELVSREHYAKGKKLVQAALVQLSDED